VIGVFTWKSLGEWLADNHDLKLDLNTLPVRDTDPEEAIFISEETYIDTAMDWSKVHYVIVGSAEKPLGVLTTTDVLGRLNDFAEAFVLLYEIEHEIRDIIKMVYSPEELAEVLGELSDTSGNPEATAEKTLRQLLQSDDAQDLPAKVKKTIEHARGMMDKAVRAMKNRQSADGLEDLSFAQYRTIIFSKRREPDFRNAFRLRHYDMLRSEFHRINDLRNVVFHFRRAITTRDTDRLRRFLQKRREDRAVLMDGPQPLREERELPAKPR